MQVDLSRPAVCAVVVDFNGGDDVVASVRALLASEWPAERLRVVVVDNASIDGSAARAGAVDPARVTVLRAPRNLGFAGGCQLALSALRLDEQLVALVNPDAFVAPGWLVPLVDALAADERLGAACPKLLLAPGDATAGELGEAGVDAARDELGAVGDAGEARSPRAAGGAGRVDAGGSAGGAGRADAGGSAGGAGRAGAGGATREAGEAAGARAADQPTDAIGGRAGPDLAGRFGSVGPDAAATGAGSAPAVLNNAGALVRRDGFGVERGFGEPDVGQYDEPVETFAWNGGCVLLRRAYLDDVGGFDERLFLYYEDTDLAWRGRLRGWRYAYVPASVVRHRHGGSTGAGGGGAVHAHYSERNRLVVLAKLAPWPMALAQWARYPLSTASYALARLRGRADVAPPGVLGRRVRAFGGALRLLPHALRERRRVRRRRTVGDDAIVAALTPVATLTR